MEVGFMTLSSAYKELLIRGKSPGGWKCPGREMSGYHFLDGVKDGCQELKLPIFKALFNIERFSWCQITFNILYKSLLYSHYYSWCQIVGFNSSFNIVVELAICDYLV